MSMWFLTVFCLLLTLVPVTIATVRGDALDRLIGMALGGIIVTLGLISLAVASGKSIYIDAAIVVAFLSFAGGVAFPHFLERWL